MQLCGIVPAWHMQDPGFGSQHSTVGTNEKMSRPFLERLWLLCHEQLDLSIARLESSVHHAPPPIFFLCTALTDLMPGTRVCVHVECGVCVCVFVVGLSC